MDEKASEVTTQMLIDAGLNAFGLQLFAESIAGKKDVKTFSPLSFRYRGVKMTIEPDPESWRDPMGRPAQAETAASAQDKEAQSGGFDGYGEPKA